MIGLHGKASGKSSDQYGFWTEVSEDQCRGDIVLDRPPLNVITMSQRDRMANAFDVLDKDDRVRVIVLRGEGECVPDDSLEDTVVSLVNELTQFSALAQRTSKNLLTAAQDAPLHVGIKMEGEAYGRLRSSNDFREGVESFNAKRKPKFRGG